jgi:hypothetical protein
MSFKIEYSPFRSRSSQSGNLMEVDDQIKIAYELNYLEFKMTRRITCYNYFSLKAVEDDKEKLEVKKGESLVNLACMLWLTYKEDEVYRGNQLKIHT